MNSFYTQEELKDIGFKSFGQNVFISKMARFYGVEKIEIGNHVRIDDFTLLSGEITLGNYIHISAFSAIYAKNRFYMEDFSGLSPRCTVFTCSDDFSGDYLMSPMTKPEHNKLQQGPVRIRKYAQIGTGSTIFPNIEIAEGTAVGAMSLVTKNTKEWTIAAGIPAKVIRKRDKGLLNFADEYK